VTGPILVLGGTGLLGHAASSALRRRSRAYTAPARRQLDLTRLTEIGGHLDALRPAAVLNLAAFTDVAGAERPENLAAATLLNADLPGVLAAETHRLGIPLVHISTDYVFDGVSRTTPYLETDPVNPTQVYGATKLAGETAAIAANPGVLILRVSTLYGPGRPQRPAYVDAILTQAKARAAEGGGVIEVVVPPVSSPTYAPDVAPLLLDLLDLGAQGIVHTVGDGAASRLELAAEAVKLAGYADRVEVRSRPEPPNTLKRPAYSVLDTGKLHRLIGRRLPRWEDALARYVREVGG
jgi:dTDP-4-dehydrorhamnose reductase